MKIGNISYTPEQVALIENAKMQIQSLQSECDMRWDSLLKNLKTVEKRVDQDYLWDYIFNDFNPSEYD